VIAPVRDLPSGTKPRVAEALAQWRSRVQDAKASRDKLTDPAAASSSTGICTVADLARGRVPGRQSDWLTAVS
jgi:hypothetical protein